MRFNGPQMLLVMKMCVRDLRGSGLHLVRVTEGHHFTVFYRHRTPTLLKGGLSYSDNTQYSVSFTHSLSHRTLMSNQFYETAQIMPKECLECYTERHHIRYLQSTLVSSTYFKAYKNVDKNVGIKVRFCDLNAKSITFSKSNKNKTVQVHDNRIVY